MNISWLLLVLSLPTENATTRQRVWRALKATGAAVLRDGVYLLPDIGSSRSVLNQIAAQVREGGGTARLLPVEDDQGEDFRLLFDRDIEYGALQADIGAATHLPDTGADDSRRRARKLRKTFESIAATDYFPGKARQQAEDALLDLERRAARADAADEPLATTSAISPQQNGDFRKRVWATRRRPWVDRLASAWLIRRFIDPEARFLWLASPADCPPDAVGFDFDGATFTHAASRVTFEVLLASFALEDAALAGIGRLVHHLDVGGAEPPEAAGIERLLAGLRDTQASDDALLAAAGAVFDALYASYQRERRAP